MNDTAVYRRYLSSPPLQVPGQSCIALSVATTHISNLNF